MMRYHGRSTAGFTLLELIVVIAIISVLAAVALPRMQETQRNARVAQAKMLYGALKSATSLARSRCELDFASNIKTLPAVNCQANPSRVNMDGKAIDMVNRHPSASATGIDTAIDVNLQAERISIGSTDCPKGARCFDITGGQTPFCRVIYIPALVEDKLLISPEISVVTSGC
ncbi:MAG: type II secretion system protein [Rhodocyclaceae bacterium]|nr:type II secretion system protein [Rhodocyclaceae bacterium]MDZ4215466.1 type II secretion system protein [Rhodocyclaceae bacterium]